MIFLGHGGWKLPLREIFIATGIITIRFTYDDCVDSPAVVARTVRDALARDIETGR